MGNLSKNDAIDQKVDSLLALMTLEEKVGQLNMYNGSGDVRPVKELKGFNRIHLDPGEETVVEFTINNKLLSFYRLDLTFGSEPGKFTVMVGGNSQITTDLEFELIR